ncbi:MAG TPA: CehA/McbA family metallohydrolase [Vicinamibacterales bacterium]|jgi:hypothetical protein|nr:CehA/McbA family metallohydrolase [Vicinamibacterales bacterium]
MKRAWFVTAAFVAAVAVLVAVTLPPARIALDRSRGDGTVPGVIHIHTNRSDGRSSPDEVADAASRAGLAFIVLTDHGNATRPPDAPVYRHGVLCLDAVEISTSGGHYVAIGLPQAPYPLAGEPRDVVDDVQRLGGFGIAAHPDSPKLEFRWTGWTAPFDGMELVNPDSGWRRRLVKPGARPKLRLLERLFSYPFRPGETIASVLAEPADNLSRWDALTRSRKVVGVAGADAHAKLALMSSEPGDNRFSLPLPGYEASFRTMSVHVEPRTPLTGQAAHDARAIVDGLRAGHVYVAVDGLASPASFSFTADAAGRSIEEGDDLVASRLTLRVSSNAPAAFTTQVLDDGRVIASSQQPAFSVQANGAGVYRVEIHATDRPGNQPWILSNPIYARSAASEPEAAPTPSTSKTPIFDGTNIRDWRVEHDTASSGALAAANSGEGPMTLAYKLSATDQTRPSVALLRNMSEGLYGNLRLGFTARADRPMRLLVELRTGVPGTPEERWQRSVYLDQHDREALVTFDDMAPLGATRTLRPALDQIRYVMFVVDPTNTKPGAAGTVTFERITLER